MLSVISVSYAECVYFHFRIFNCMLVSKVLDKNPRPLHANILLLYTDRVHPKNVREIFVLLSGSSL